MYIRQFYSYFFMVEHFYDRMWKPTSWWPWPLLPCPLRPQLLAQAAAAVGLSGVLPYPQAAEPLRGGRYCSPVCSQPFVRPTTGGTRRDCSGEKGEGGGRGGGSRRRTHSTGPEKKIQKECASLASFLASFQVSRFLIWPGFGREEGWRGGSGRSRPAQMAVGDDCLDLCNVHAANSTVSVLYYVVRTAVCYDLLPDQNAQRQQH